MKSTLATHHRAIIGAFAGFVIGGFILGIGTEFFGLRLPFGYPGEEVQRRTLILGILSGAAVLGAVIAAVFGSYVIRGRLGSTIQGIVYGGLLGVLTGSCFGPVLSPFMGKAGQALGTGRE